MFRIYFQNTVGLVVATLLEVLRIKQELFQHDNDMAGRCIGARIPLRMRI